MHPVSVFWPGGEHPFRLGIEELRALQQKTDCGPEFLLMRLRSGQWHVDDLSETLRLGLIGGGMDQSAALKIVRDAFDRYPPIRFKVTALEVLMAGVYGPAEDPAGEDSLASDPTQNPSQTDASGSAPSTPSAGRQASRRKKSDK